MTPIFFKNASEFRKWLAENYNTEKEVIVGFYKIKTGKPSMTWSESVDQALCFGWIDGIRKSIDEESYCIRFTPRNPKSGWSAINIKKIEQLTMQGLMTPQGIEVFKNRKQESSGIYSFQNRPEQLPEMFESRFKKNKNAWKFFNDQAPSYCKTAIFWILNAKTEKTQNARLERLIKASGESRRLF